MGELKYCKLSAYYSGHMTDDHKTLLIVWRGTDWWNEIII